MDSTPPSTNTRKRNKKSQRFSSEPITLADNLLPPRRSEPIIRPVSPPLSSTRLSNLIYLLIGLTTLLGAFFSYRIVQYKADVGWWNLALGRGSQMWADSGSSMRDREGERSAREESVEDRINALASALGMPSNELASAVASAVRSYVPPASLSSVAAKETGEAVKVLLSEKNGGEGHISGFTAETIGGIAGGIVNGVEGFVGMEEPLQ